jgi:hypothetical protein
MNIDTLKMMPLDDASVLEVKAMLPYGSQRVIFQRLQQRGCTLSYVTVNKFKNPEVIKEAIALLNDLREEKKKRVREAEKVMKKLREENNPKTEDDE